MWAAIKTESDDLTTREPEDAPAVMHPGEQEKKDTLGRDALMHKQDATLLLVRAPLGKKCGYGFDDVSLCASPASPWGLGPRHEAEAPRGASSVRPSFRVPRLSPEEPPGWAAGRVFHL